WRGPSTRAGTHNTHSDGDGSSTRAGTHNTHSDRGFPSADMGTRDIHSTRFPRQPVQDRRLPEVVERPQVVERSRLAPAAGGRERHAPQREPRVARPSLPDPRTHSEQRCAIRVLVSFLSSLRIRLNITPCERTQYPKT